ncbi:hypothetical protein GGR54DRAFT_192528 [Hypoxylon sp. NC1633]|nr:hypothetical protein GGR54DRAFT_192528 [Hypoxylon sp. NC1633]
MALKNPDLLVNAFDGAITARKGEQRPNRAFDFDVTFILTHPHLITLASQQKPPMHFHPYQEEYITVVEGVLGVDVEGKEYRLTPKDGEFPIRPWLNHRLYPILLPGHEITRFLLSAEDSHKGFQLDTLFFQNWYGYQDECLMSGKDFNLIQVLSMFDAGGCCMTFPNWVPFGRTLSQVTGVVVGRWLGSFLGYQPFYRHWTSDWELACKKMSTSVFLKRFAKGEKSE